MKNGYTLQLYLHNRIHCSPRTWKSTATKIAASELFNGSKTEPSSTAFGGVKLDCREIHLLSYRSGPTLN